MINYDVPLGDVPSSRSVPKVPRVKETEEEKQRWREFGRQLLVKFYARYTAEHGVTHPQNWPKHTSIMTAFARRYGKARSMELVDFLYDHHHGVFGPKRQRQGVEFFSANCDWLIRDLVASMGSVKQTTGKPSAWDGIVTAEQVFGA